LHFYLYCAEKNASTGTRKENGSNKAGRTNGLRVLGAYMVLDGGIPEEMEIYVNDEKVKIK